MRYPEIAALQVGQEIFVAWTLPDGSIDNRMRMNLAATIRRYGARHRKRFEMKGHPRGLYVMRISDPVQII